MEDKVSISSNMNLEFRLNQDMFTYLMRILDLNVNYIDQQEKYFQFREWNSANTLKVYN